MKPDRPQGIWHCLDVMPTYGAVLAEWRQLLGHDFEPAVKFLVPTNRQAESYPCTHFYKCGCKHMVSRQDNDHFVAICQCETNTCPPIPIQPTDLIVHELAVRKFCEALRYVFGFNAGTGAASHGATIGVYSPINASVYFERPQDDLRFLNNVTGLLNSGTSPFILLTPSRSHYSAAIEATLKQAGCLLMPCSFYLSMAHDGSLRLIQPIEDLLTVFRNRQVEGQNLVRVVESIRTDIHTVATNANDLRKENEELRALADGGFLKFATKVSADDFRIFAAIMVGGNRKKAAFDLEIPERTLYSRVELWPTKGPEYKRMLNLVEWRKKQGRQITVRLEDSIAGTENTNHTENPKLLSETLASIRANPDSNNHEAFLRDILEALSAQNPTNWNKIQAELIQIIREELSQ